MPRLAAVRLLILLPPNTACVNRLNSVEVSPMNRSDHSSAPRLAGGLDRRQFLRGIAATGAMAGAGGLLAACGGSGLSGDQSETAGSSAIFEAGAPGSKELGKSCFA